MDNSFDHNSKPVYNIKAVSKITGLLPVTIRAWERRYGIPQPERGDQGYRLYSEEDLRILRWLKKQVDSGLSISRAVDHLNDLRENGLKTSIEPIQAVEYERIGTIENLRVELAFHLSSYDEKKASETFRRGVGIYAIDQVLEDIIKPILIEIGEKWHRGEIPIAQEHFITQFFIQHILSMVASSPPPTRQGVIIAAGAPMETHQVGILSIVLMLRWRGWDVRYLGPNLSLERLEEALSALHPKLILFSATRKESAEALTKIPEIISQFSSPQPKVMVGGQAFQSDATQSSQIQISKGGSIKQITQEIEALIHEKN